MKKLIYLVSIAVMAVFVVILTLGVSSDITAFSGNGENLQLADGYTDESSYVSHDSVIEKEDTNAQLEDAIREIIEENINTDMTDFEKVKVIHDYIVENTDYLDESGVNILSEYAFSAYGALVLQKAASQGYALAFTKIMEKLGISTEIVNGKYKGENHYWNTVCVDGQWYNIDISGDDPTIEGHVIRDGKNRTYDYFLLSDYELQKSHNTGSRKSECVSDTYDDYAMNSILTQYYSVISSEDTISEIVKQYRDDGIYEFQILYNSKECEIDKMMINEAVTDSYYTEEGCRISLRLESVREYEIVHYIVEFE